MTGWISAQKVVFLCVVAVLCVVLLSGLAEEANEANRGVEPILMLKGRSGGGSGLAPGCDECGGNKSEKQASVYRGPHLDDSANSHFCGFSL